MVTMAKYWTKIRILSSLAFSVLLFAVVLPGQYPSVHSPRQWQGSPPYWILYFSLPFKRVASIILILSKWSSLRWGLFVQYFQKASGVISNSRYRILSRLPTFITFAKQYHLWCWVPTLQFRFSFRQILCELTFCFGGFTFIIKMIITAQKDYFCSIISKHLVWYPIVDIEYCQDCQLWSHLQNNIFSVVKYQLYNSDFPFLYELPSYFGGFTF